MGFIKYIKSDTLSDEEKKELKQQLQDHKKSLLEEIKRTDKGLAAINKRKPKKAKKAKKEA